MALLSIIIPCYNERATVYELLRRVVEQDLSDLEIEREILIVDDGSSDGSRDEIERFATDHPDAPVRFLRHRANRGKGAAIRTALAETRGDFILIQDADLEYAPADYSALLRPVISGVSSVVYGSRWLAKDLPASGSLYAVGGWLINRFLGVLYRTNVSDVATCYKLFRAEVLHDLDLQCTGFEFCFEATAKLLNRRVFIVEVPIRYTPRKKREGKKVRLRDFFIAIATLVRIRFGRGQQTTRLRSE